MSYKNIKIEITGGIAVLTLNRPEVRNALDFETWEEIRSYCYILAVSYMNLMLRFGKAIHN